MDHENLIYVTSFAYFLLKVLIKVYFIEDLQKKESVKMKQISTLALIAFMPSCMQDCYCKYLKF